MSAQLVVLEALRAERLHCINSTSSDSFSRVAGSLITAHKTHRSRCAPLLLVPLHLPALSSP